MQISGRLPDQECGGWALCLLGVLGLDRVGREGGGWPGEAIILCGSLDLCCLQLDIGDCPADKSFTAIFSGGKGL